MAETGVNWPADSNWTGEFSGTLTTAGTDDDISAVIRQDVKASTEISIDADYSNHAKATGGLVVSVLRDVNGTDYELDPKTQALSPVWQFEMAFVQNATIRKTFTVYGMDISQFKIHLHWKNTTGSSNVAVVTSYQQSNIPAAS